MRIARIGEQRLAVAILWRQSVLQAVLREASAKYEVPIYIEATTCLGNSMVLGLSDRVEAMALVSSAVTSLPYQAVTGLLCWNRSAMAENEAAFRISSGTSASTDSTRSSITAKQPSTPTAASVEAALRNGAGAGAGVGTGPAHIDTDASTPHHHK